MAVIFHTILCKFVALVVIATSLACHFFRGFTATFLFVGAQQG